MDNLWLFYPQNDAALASGKANFTAPRAAALLQRSGELLPLWMCDIGDKVVCDGVNESWFEKVTTDFHLLGDVWNHSDHHLRPTPWGWSGVSRKVFERLGFTSAQLPSDAQLEAWRRLSHRRTCAELARKTAAHLSEEIYEPAIEIFNIDELSGLIGHWGEVVVKSPWSSSGRGVNFVNAMSSTASLVGLLRRQGSLLVERRVGSVFDFALLFNVNNGLTEFKGYSVFETDRGNYRGNLVCDDTELEKIIASRVGLAALREVRGAICRELSQIARGYEGPVGVDMLCDREGKMHIVESNFRYTMGFVAQSLSRIVAGKAYFNIKPTNLAVNHIYHSEDSKLIDGTLALTPPEGDFSFELESINF